MNWIERAVGGICRAVLWVSTSVIFVILCGNTVLRYATGASLQWGNEVPELLFPWLVMAGVVLLVIMASAAIGWLLTFDRMPDGVVAWAQANLSSGWTVILLMNLLMLVCGMFIDLPAAVLLLTPVFVPLANAIGMDLTQLGIMMTVNLAIGLYTPPVGTTLFITSAVAKVKVGETVRELGPFYFVAFLILLLVSYVPATILK